MLHILFFLVCLMIREEKKLGWKKKFQEGRKKLGWKYKHFRTWFFRKEHTVLPGMLPSKFHSFFFLTRLVLLRPFYGRQEHNLRHTFLVPFMCLIQGFGTSYQKLQRKHFICQMLSILSWIWLTLTLLQRWRSVSCYPKGKHLVMFYQNGSMKDLRGIYWK